LGSIVDGPHGFVNVAGEFGNSVNAPLESSRKKVTAPVGLLFTIVSTNSQGCGVCAKARKIPAREASVAAKQIAIARRRRLPPEGREIIPDFLVLNARFSLFTR
jgi:hypothetical protein